MKVRLLGGAWSLVQIPFFLLLSIAVLAAAGVARADGPGRPGWFEGFEGPHPTWAEAGGDVPHAIRGHGRTSDGPHSGQRCEWLQLSCGQGGTAVWIAHDVGFPRIIDDLRVVVWLRSDRPGASLSLEVVLPRSIDPRTSRPFQTRLPGPMYTDAGRWQRLAIDATPQRLARQLRILRSQSGIDVDGGEAYVSRVLLNVYAGPGIGNVWIDDLEVAGHVPFPRAAALRAAGGPAAAAVATANNRGVPDTAGPAVQLTESTLLVAGRPMLPRAIQYQGEPLAFLQQLGFNTVWLREVPRPEFLAEAGRLGLWLICPPPPLGEKGDSPHLCEAPGGPFRQMGTVPFFPRSIGPEFQGVLAWDMGTGLTAAEAKAHRGWADQLRLADARGRRPLVCCPASDLRDYCRHVDVLLIDRRGLGTSLEMPDYGRWVQRQPLLAVLGTPVWTVIQTQMGEGLRRQLAAIGPGWATPAAFAPEQIRLLVWTALSCGSRGLIFQSQSPLSAADPETRQRATAMQLLNVELNLIEPWVAAGTFVDVAQSSQPQVSGAVLRCGRARLVLPAWISPRSQCVAPEAAASSLALLVPTIPESASAYQIVAGRLEPLRRTRDTGGTFLTLDDFNLTDMVLAEQDPSVYNGVSERVKASGKAIAQLERQWAAQKLDADQRLLGAVARRLPPALDVSGPLAAARRDLAQADARLRAGDFPAAALSARRAMRPLRKLESAVWSVAMWELAPPPPPVRLGPRAAARDLKTVSPVTSPGTVCFATLPWHWNLVDRVRGMHPGPNRLPGGDFEDFQVWLKTGWRFERHAIPAVQSAADLVPEAAHSGRWGLRLTARPDDPANPPAMLEMPPVWITTPAVPVEAGRIVRIHGWAQVPARLAGSVDGLLVIDSLSGLDLAERIDQTNGWREFTMYRACDRPGVMTVTFALTGMGEARLDDVTIEVLEPNR